MTIRSRRCLLSVFALLLTGLAAASAVPTWSFADQSLPPPFTEFGLGAAERRAIEEGAVVSADVRTSTKKELLGVVAMRLPIAPAEVARLIRAGINVLADPRIDAYAVIPTDGVDSSRGNLWRDVGYAPSELAEARRLATVEPGTGFNFSAAEIAAVNARFGAHRASADDMLAAAGGAWREVLAGRLHAYREFGLTGLPSYDRGGTASLPGDELRHAGGAPSVPPSLAAFVRAIDRFPALPPGIDHRFFWKKTEMDDRPAFVLAHVLVEERPEAVRYALREFYVSHTYNVLQQLGLVLPADDGSLLLVINSTITDRLPGVFTSLARSIGARRARDALEAYFASIRTLSANLPASGG